MTQSDIHNAAARGDAATRKPEISRPDIRSMGCRLNLAEGEAISQMLAGPDGGDVVVVNSCAVTREALRQTRQTIRRARREKPAATLVVTGCAAQIDPSAYAAMAEVDHVVGNAEKLNAGLWRDLAQRKAPAIAVNDIMSARETAGPLIDGYGERARAFLQVQNGCDHRCTFCIIPFGRGPARSAPIATVIDQARRLVDKGHKELVLTGVDITSWGDDLDGTPPLGALVEAVLAACPDLFRLRLSSIDGAEIDPLLFDLVAGEARIAAHVHLSVQSGDDMILKRMKRRHNRDDIIRLCHDLRARRPEIAFGADMIAGFPTETEAMFENSRALVDDAGIAFLHVFPFSPHDGAPASRMPQLERGLVKERARILRETGDAARARFLDSLVGLETSAVAESGQRARLSNFAEARLAAPADGDIVRIRITGRDGDILTARTLADCEAGQ